MRHRLSCTFDAPPEEVSRVLCSEAFHRDSDRQRQDVSSSEYRLVEQGEQRRVFEVHTREYHRSRLGKMDRGRTVPSTTFYRWDGRRGTLAWVYKGQEHLGHINLSGAYTLTPEGGGTRVVQEVEIEVRIPLVGNQVAKLIAREMDRAFQDWRRLVARHLGRTP